MSHDTPRFSSFTSSNLMTTNWDEGFVCVVTQNLNYSGPRNRKPPRGVEDYAGGAQSLEELKAELASLETSHVD